MKSQDIGLLLKLISLQKKEAHAQVDILTEPVFEWRDWDDIGDIFESNYVDEEKFKKSLYTIRNLELETGISKTQVSESLRRCMDVGLAKLDRRSNVPRANTKSLFEFIFYGLKYVFPTKPGDLTRGIGTSFCAPVLQGKLISAGDFNLVWPDARANNKGLSIEPLFHSVTYAIRKDPDMYAFLALVDAIRIGSPREANLAAELLKKRMELTI